jgi:four helix bundle protein
MNKSTITKHSFDLEERTLKFAKLVLNLCKQLTQNVINKELISQLVRSSGSVGANYREANDSLSKKDFRHTLLA